MNIYGYESDESELISLEEINLRASVDELNDLVDFLKNTIKIIESSKGNFGHEHFSDFVKKSPKEKPEIIIVNNTID